MPDDITGKNPTSTRPGPEGVGVTNKSPGATGGDYTFRCADVHSSCSWQTRASSEDELRTNVERHGREQHNMTEFGEDAWNRIRSFIRRQAA